MRAAFVRTLTMSRAGTNRCPTFRLKCAGDVEACVLVVAGRRQRCQQPQQQRNHDHYSSQRVPLLGQPHTGNERLHFEVYTRTAQVLADSIAEAQFETIDSPLTPANVKDVISAIRAKLDSLVTAGKLIGAECWYDVVDNSTTDLRQGRVRIRYKYTPVPPLEDMELYQTFTDEYFEPAFAVLGGA